MQRLGKLPAQSVQVTLLHAKDDIRPAQVTFRNRDPRIRLRPR